MQIADCKLQSFKFRKLSLVAIYPLIAKISFRIIAYAYAIYNFLALHFDSSK